MQTRSPELSIEDVSRGKQVDGEIRDGWRDTVSMTSSHGTSPVLLSRLSRPTAPHTRGHR